MVHFLIFRDCDVNNSSGSAYLAGSPIYALGASLQINSSNRIQKGNQGTQDAYPSQDSFNNGSNIRRLLPTYSNFGLDDINISINGGYSSDTGSFFKNGSYQLTPTRLLAMSTRGRTFYVCDQYLIPMLIDGDTGSENLNANYFTGSAFKNGQAYFSKYGIPMIIDKINFNQGVTDKYHITWSVSGFIDNGSYNWYANYY